MFVTIIMKHMKKSGASPVDTQFFPGMQSGSTCIQSYMILFQSSPVDIENNSEKLWWKLVKFL